MEDFMKNKNNSKPVDYLDKHNQNCDYPNNLRGFYSWQSIALFLVAPCISSAICIHQLYGSLIPQEHEIQISYANHLPGYYVPASYSGTGSGSNYNEGEQVEPSKPMIIMTEDPPLVTIYMEV
jgi:hypothetical protein